MDAAWMETVVERLPDLWLRTGEHLALVGIAVGAAVALGVPLGVLASRVAWLRSPLMGVLGVVQTVPSLAMLAILLGVLGMIGVVPATVALALYALLPITRNTLTGLSGVPPATLEAARGMGMTRWQQLRLVKMPLALPVMVAGIRTAAVIAVGIATLSAFIGAGGLGQFIIRGLGMNNRVLVLYGAIPAAILALLVDGAIWAAEWGLKPARRHERGTLKARLKPAAKVAPLVLAVLGFVAWATGGKGYAEAPEDGTVAGGREPTVLRIGSKEFSEQFILGELMAQMIEARTDLAVERVFALGGTMICHGALAKGEIDLYAEYTGTGYQAVLKESGLRDPQAVLEAVRQGYAARFALVWLEPFGFNNTYALTVRQADAEEKGWEAVSDLVAVDDGLMAGFTSEFQEREDGYPGLREAYGLRFGGAVDMSASLMYEAVARGQVDVICAFATDGRIAAYDLVTLDDDRHFFPPYHAAPVVRREVLEAHPEVRRALEVLGGRLDDGTMRRLNYRVDGHKEAPEDVARDFLVEQGLVEGDAAVPAAAGADEAAADGDASTP